LQKYLCHDCRHVWQAKRHNLNFDDKLYESYSIGKQTLSELSLKHGLSTRTIRRHFDKLALDNHSPPAPAYAVALTFDATYFGRGFGYMIYRSEGRTILWQAIESETLAIVRLGIATLLAQNWRFSSVTLDGRRGYIQILHQLLPSVPVQLCLFHQKATIRRYTTSRPKTDCGKAIFALSNDLLHLDKTTFMTRLNDLKSEFKDFLKERNELKAFKHRRLRAALRSFTTHVEYLFNWKKFPEKNIPNTTNSCDGSFAHWKAKVKIHRGLKRERKHKMAAFLIQKS
jgi:hypothetical protein